MDGRPKRRSKVCDELVWTVGLTVERCVLVTDWCGRYT